MKVKIDKFCNLSTSPSWQSWLYHHHVLLYRKFINRLREARGCGQNSELMTEVLQEINNNGGGDALLDFLQMHYPDMLEGKPVVAHQQNGEVFQHYNPDILTYPRRRIFSGPSSRLKGKAQEFLLDKFRGDFIILGERAYIEYLEKGDAHLADQIPIKNWQIAAYRQR